MNLEELSRELRRSAARAPMHAINGDAVIQKAKHVQRRRRVVVAACALTLVAAGTTTGLLLSTDTKPVSTIAPQPLPRPSAPSPPPTPKPTPSVSSPGPSPAALPPGWTAAAPPPNQYALGGAVVSGKLFVLAAKVGQGGVGGYESESTEGEVFDLAKRAWTKTAPSSLPGRYGAAAAGSDRLFFVWGGAQEPPAVNPKRDGATYDLTANTWHVLPSAPLEAGPPLGAAWDGQEFVVVGGRKSAAYNPVTDTWRQLPSIPTPLAKATVVQVADRTYLIGADSFYLLPGATSWTRIPSLPNGYPATLIAATDGRSLFAAGHARKAAGSSAHAASARPIRRRLSYLGDAAGGTGPFGRVPTSAGCHAPKHLSGLR